MQYRYLGPTGIKVSVISLGNWINSCSEETKKTTFECVKRAWELGINFFDTSEAYCFGEAERQLGEALRGLGLSRSCYVVSTKIYRGTVDFLPNTIGLSRKHLIEGVRASLSRLGMDYVDVLFCHKPDYECPMQQTCRTLDWIVRKGWAFYWGTSQWTPADIAQAHMICQKYNLIKPVTEQSQYNLFYRQKVQVGYRHLLKDRNMGLTTYSPLANGILTGKYKSGIPKNSRFDKRTLSRIWDKYLSESLKPKTEKSLLQFQKLAQELQCSMAQLAMAWVIRNPHVSSAITGVSEVGQLEDTIKALEVRGRIGPEVQGRLEGIFGGLGVGKVDVGRVLGLGAGRRLDKCGQKRQQMEQKQIEYAKMQQTQENQP